MAAPRRSLRLGPRSVDTRAGTAPRPDSPQPRVPASGGSTTGPCRGSRAEGERADPRRPRDRRSRCRWRGCVSRGGSPCSSRGVYDSGAARHSVQDMASEPMSVGERRVIEIVGWVTNHPDLLHHTTRTKISTAHNPKPCRSKCASPRSQRVAFIGRQDTREVLHHPCVGVERGKRRAVFRQPPAQPQPVCPEFLFHGWR